MAGGTPRRGRASGRGRATGRRGDGRTVNRGGARAARGSARRGGTLRTLSRAMARGGGVGGGSGVNGRIRLLGIALTAFLLLVGFRAVALASSSANLGRIAQEQQTATITLPSHRGSILDRDGNELAVGQPAQTVYATPYLLHGRAAAVSAADKLCGALHIHKKSQRRALEKALSQSKSGFAYVARMVDPQLAKAALALNIPGVGSYAEEERVYPMKDSATQLLGVTGVDNNGLAGLELQYNKALSGKAGSETVVRDPAGQTLKVVHQTQPVSGADVRLTIDEEIQCTAEAVLKQTLRTSGAKQATAIVMDPRSGEVLAMANLPMEANANYGDKPAWDRNRAVTDVYEPGSIFKLVTVSGALAEGLVTPQQRFWCPPTLRVADRVIHEAETRGGEDFSVTDIIAQSSNIGAVKIGKLMGMDGLIHWMKVFGFDKPTGRGLPRRGGGHRAGGRPVVGLVDRQHPHRPGRRGDAYPDGGGLLGGRQRRRVREAPAGRPGGHQGVRHAAGAPHRTRDRGSGDAQDAGGRGRPRHRHQSADPRLCCGWQDRHGAEARQPRRLLRHQLRGLVRRHGARRSPSTRGAGLGRRAA